MGSAPRPPTQEQVQKSGSIFPTPKLKVGATQQGSPVQKKNAFSPPTPGHSSNVAISLPKQEIPPKPHRGPAALTLPVGSTLVDMGGGGPTGIHED